MSHHYIIDTHALVWYLDDDPRLGKVARRIIEGEGKLLIFPTIVLAEIYYLHCRRPRLPSLEEVFHVLDRDPRVLIYPLEIGVVHSLPAGLNIHDAIITATALVIQKALGEEVSVITRDEEIIGSKIVSTVWE